MTILLLKVTVVIVLENQNQAGNPENLLILEDQEALEEIGEKMILLIQVTAVLIPQAGEIRILLKLWILNRRKFLMVF